MKNVLIINGHQKYDQIAEGNLTKLFIDTACDFFTKNGLNVKHSIVESEYVLKDELEKFAWADYIILQYPWTDIDAVKNLLFKHKELKEVFDYINH